jgi:ParB family chromosome partitioning protein
MAMIENIQREDLDLIEIAMQYRALVENKVFESLSELSIAVGKDKADISKTINILKLPLEITEDVRLNKSTTDLKVLDALRKLNNDEKAIKLYKWFISSSVTRDDLIAKVKEMLGRPKEKQNSYEIKNSNKGCVIKLPELNDSELEKVSTFVDGIVKNRG